MLEPRLVALPEGSTFQGRYRVVRCIKTGGMGAVYEVIHLDTRRRRALKVMLPSLVSDADLRARFAQEATVTAEVESEHVVETFDAGVDPETGVPFIVMELLKGDDLQTILKQRGRLPQDEVILLLRQTALALDRVHALDIVHRDLKPDNLFLTRRDDGSPRIKVLDFGVSKLVAQSTSVAHTTRALGTPMYMSPEQIKGDGTIDHRSDLYALGHIAYALLTGHAYWSLEAKATGAVFALLVKVMRGAPESATARAEKSGVLLPATFDDWFAKTTALRREDRFRTAEEQIEALAKALTDTRKATLVVGAGAEAPADSFGRVCVLPGRWAGRDVKIELSPTEPHDMGSDAPPIDGRASAENGPSSLGGKQAVSASPPPSNAPRGSSKAGSSPPRGLEVSTTTTAPTSFSAGGLARTQKARMRNIGLVVATTAGLVASAGISWVSRAHGPASSSLQSVSLGAAEPPSVPPSSANASGPPGAAASQGIAHAGGATSVAAPAPSPAVAPTYSASGRRPEAPTSRGPVRSSPSPEKTSGGVASASPTDLRSAKPYDPPDVR